MNRRLTGPGAWVLYVITALLMVFILAPLVVVIAGVFVWWKRR